MGDEERRWSERGERRCRRQGRRAARGASAKARRRRGGVRQAALRGSVSWTLYTSRSKQLSEHTSSAHQNWHHSAIDPRVLRVHLGIGGFEHLGIGAPGYACRSTLVGVVEGYGTYKPFALLRFTCAPLASLRPLRDAPAPHPLRFRSPLRRHMARISDKALRPRQYVFNRFSSPRIAALAPAIRELRQRERRHAASSPSPERPSAQPSSSPVPNHAQLPRSDQILALESELNDLRSQKRQLFDTLRTTLDDPDAPCPPSSAAVAAAPRPRPSSNVARRPAPTTATSACATSPALPPPSAPAPAAKKPSSAAVTARQTSKGADGPPASKRRRM